MDYAEIGAHALTICLGLGLAAAAGFRVFVPLLVMSAASYTGHLQLSHGFEWLGTGGALVVLSTATVLEILAYYVPWLDNLLDSIAGPAAVVAGSVVAASAFSDIDPLLKWSLAIIGGGGLAGVMKGATTLARGASSLTTGGLANPILSTFEVGASFLLSGFAIVLPLVTFAVVLVVFFFVVKKLIAWLSRRQRSSAGDVTAVR